MMFHSASSATRSNPHILKISVAEFPYINVVYGMVSWWLEDIKSGSEAEKAKN